MNLMHFVDDAASGLGVWGNDRGGAWKEATIGVAGDGGGLGRR